MSNWYAPSSVAKVYQPSLSLQRVQRTCRARQRPASAWRGLVCLSFRTCCQGLIYDFAISRQSGVRRSGQWLEWMNFSELVLVWVFCCKTNKPPKFALRCPAVHSRCLRFQLMHLIIEKLIITLIVHGDTSCRQQLVPGVAALRNATLLFW